MSLRQIDFNRIVNKFLLLANEETQAGGSLKQKKTTGSLKIHGCSDKNSNNEQEHVLRCVLLELSCKNISASC